MSISRRSLLGAAVGGTVALSTRASEPDAQTQAVHPRAFEFAAAYMVIHSADGTPIYQAPITNAGPIRPLPGDTLTIQATITFT